MNIWGCNHQKYNIDPLGGRSWCVESISHHSELIFCMYHTKNWRKKQIVPPQISNNFHFSPDYCCTTNILSLFSHAFIFAGYSLGAKKTSNNHFLFVQGLPVLMDVCLVGCLWMSVLMDVCLVGCLWMSVLMGVFGCLSCWVPMDFCHVGCLCLWMSVLMVVFGWMSVSALRYHLLPFPYFT